MSIFLKILLAKFTTIILACSYDKPHVPKAGTVMSWTFLIIFLNLPDMYNVIYFYVEHPDLVKECKRTHRRIPLSRGPNLPSITNQGHLAHQTASTSTNHSQRLSSDTWENTTVYLHQCGHTRQGSSLQI